MCAESWEHQVKLLDRALEKAKTEARQEVIDWVDDHLQGGILPLDAWQLFKKKLGNP